MTDFGEALARLLESEEYKTWKKENKHTYLVHGFVMIDPQVKEEWQLGFYSSKEDKVITFTLGDKITVNPAAEVLKEEGALIPLEADKVKFPLTEALAKCEALQKEKYKSHTPFKKIVLLQKLDLGQVWNITFVTNTFKVLNMKLDSITGDMLSDDLVELFKIER
ncbi:MAG: hypothetical protein HGA85_02535 [Nanoarchaeota archaeon]|nr:hypothetical protein [Nanoarchaeota archaeon]